MRMADEQTAVAAAAAAAHHLRLILIIKTITCTRARHVGRDNNYAGYV